MIYWTFLILKQRSGRLPTFWFVKRNLEKSFMTPRARRTKEIIDISQHTQIEEVNKENKKKENLKKFFRSKKCHHRVNKHPKK